MTHASAVRWKASELIWRSWNGESVVFHVPSADTHLLTPIAARVLQTLEQQPATALQIAEKLASAEGVDLDQDLIQHVAGLLASLNALGLVESLSL